MGAKSRRKGAQAERDICNIDAMYGFTSERTAPLQAGYGSKDWDDAMCKQYPMSLLKREVKRYKRTPVNRFCREYLEQEVPGFVPCLVHRDDNASWMATLQYHDLVKLMAALRDTKAKLDEYQFKGGGNVAV